MPDIKEAWRRSLQPTGRFDPGVEQVDGLVERSSLTKAAMERRQTYPPFKRPIFGERRISALFGRGMDPSKDDDMPSARELSPEFVALARAGDRNCEERLLAKLRPILHTYFIKRVGLKPEVEDLVQNTLLRVHNGLKDLEHPERLMGFVMKAALYELHDLYRGRYSGREALYDPAVPPATAISDPTDESMDAERALSVLSPRARQILELKEYGYKYKEIAAMIHTSEAAVKMQVKRAFERMRRLLVA